PHKNSRPKSGRLSFYGLPAIADGCTFVLIDLKTAKISHQDIGQMDMYVRMYDELKRTQGDNPTNRQHGNSSFPVIWWLSSHEVFS
uniref:PDDEXK nuclease domain-containing protein n=1 Tax=Barnesiella sp. CU968 TaxID=2780099 RepID=UPI00195B5EE5